MSKKTRNILIGIIASIVTIGVGTYIIFSSGQGFDAKGYVSAILDKTLKGETKAAAQILKGTTEESLYAQYDAEITSFVKQIIKGVEMDAETEDKYVELCKKIFASMKYEVQDVKETEDEGYEVIVRYQPSDVFSKFVVAAEEEKTRLEQKVDDCEYRGTIEEISVQMQADLVVNAYSLLEQCYKDMQYGEEKTMIFSIVKDKDGKYSMNAEQISEFVGKIIALDEIQD